MPHRRQRGGQAGDRPRGPRPRRLTRGPRAARRESPRCGTGPACSPGAPAPPAAATPTTPSRTAAADPPARATWPRCAEDTTGSRPTATGPTPPSNPACYLWTSRHGYQYLRDPDGTLDVSARPPWFRDRRCAPSSTTGVTTPPRTPPTRGAIGTPGRAIWVRSDALGCLGRPCALSWRHERALLTPAVSAAPGRCARVRHSERSRPRRPPRSLGRSARPRPSQSDTRGTPTS